MVNLIKICFKDDTKHTLGVWFVQVISFLSPYVVVVYCNRLRECETLRGVFRLEIS